MTEFLVEENGRIYEISELVTSIAYTDKLNDGCSKLEFAYLDDDLRIQNGSVVRFTQADFKFYGYVFKHSKGKDKEINITAYDQLRYAKAKDVIVSQKDTVTSLGKRMCNYLGLNQGVMADTRYILPTAVDDNKTWLDIMYGAIGDTLANTGRWYALRDEFGSVTIRNLEDLQLDLVLGDESLTYDYDYSKSIDDDFYNRVKIYVKDKEKSVGRFVLREDKESIRKYGLLQYFETLDNNGNISQAQSKARLLLGLYNQETEKLTLRCLGDTRVRAGTSIYADIEDIELEKRLIISSVTHEFMPVHTMTIEVRI